MKSLKSAFAGVATLAIVGGGLLLGAVPAAAAAPAFEPDPNASLGSITFYDAAGNVVTSGNNLNHLFDYAVASTPDDRTGTPLASTYFAFPDHTKADSSTWFISQASGATNYPATSAPAPVNGFTNPTATIGSTEGNLAAQLGVVTLDHTTGYDNIVQVRLKDSGAGKPARLKPFWATDIQFNAAAGTWTQVYPAVVQSTSTTLTATPDPSTVGQTVTLTATETPAAAGSVQFKDGASNIGSPVAVNGSGVATTTTSTLTQGSHALSAVFTPTDTTSFGGSTGNFTATVNPPATPTTTTLAISGSPTTTGSAATLTATVAPSAAAGTVAFYDNGSATPLTGTASNPTAGTYVLDLPSGFTAGGHSIVAKFSPTTVTQYQASQSAPSAFITQNPVVGACAQPGSACTNTDYIQATVPVGTLVLSTPYVDAAHALDLGTLALNGDSTQLNGQATFQNIKVTDTRSGNLPWTLTALASNLTDGGSNPNSVIDNQNLGLTGITSAPGTGFTGTVTPVNNPAAAAVAPGAAGSLGLGGTTAHTIATADHGLGTVTMQGTLTLNAPSSTEPGLFTGTITFTVG